jgi:type IV pilus assembly protein PilP
MHWVIVGVLASLFLCACSSSEDELSRYIHAVKSRPPSPRTIEPIPEFKPLAKFSFPANEKRRSPFKAIQRQGQIDINSPNMNRPKQPLEAFPLDALKFVGILKQGNSIWALISQPGGLVTRARVGDYMGKNFGQITHIKENKINIEETVQLGGRWEKKHFSLNLNPLD